MSVNLSSFSIPVYNVYVNPSEWNPRVRILPVLDEPSPRVKRRSTTDLSSITADQPLKKRTKKEIVKDIEQLKKQQLELAETCILLNKKVPRSVLSCSTQIKLDALMKVIVDRAMAAHQKDKSFCIDELVEREKELEAQNASLSEIKLDIFVNSLFDENVEM